MTPARHSSNNFEFGAPKDWKEDNAVKIGTLPATVGETEGFKTITSYWRPSPTEMLELNNGRLVELRIMGQGMPIVSVGVETTN